MRRLFVDRNSDIDMISKGRFHGLTKGFKCDICGYPLKLDYTSPPYHKCGPPTHRDKTKSADCTHRGDELRMEQCKTCQGNVRVKVFACAVHGECTLAKQVGVAVCHPNCPDYESETEE